MPLIFHYDTLAATPLRRFATMPLPPDITRH